MKRATIPQNTMPINRQQASFFIVTSVALLAVCFVCTATAELSCLDEEGKTVDWFIGYKLPKFSKDNDPLLSEGLAYVYLTNKDLTDAERDEVLNSTRYSDSSVFLETFRNLLESYLGITSAKTQARTRSRKLRTEFTKRWIASEKPLSDPDSILSRTLEVAYDSRRGKTISSIFYNDDPSGTDDVALTSSYPTPNKPNNSRAHAKGVLMMELKSDTGIWVTHSIPRFPNERKVGFSYPESATVYGQTFMCISFGIKQTAEKLIDHLVNMRPLVYDNEIEDKLRELYPALENLREESKMKHKRVGVVPDLAQHIVTRGGQMMRIFSKSADLNGDLYSGVIGEEMGTDLYVETWRKGSGGTLPSTCRPGQHLVNNILTLSASFGETFKKWAYTYDHSKWAISEEKEPGVVCIGDINRQESQFKRGGGAVCMKCPTCWSVFNTTINEVEPCPVPLRKSRSTRRVDKGILERISTALHL